MVTKQEAQKNQTAWMAVGQTNSSRTGTIAITDIWQY
jgi:hypothetical protein